MIEAIRGLAEILQSSVRPVVTIMFALGLVHGFETKLIGAEAFLSVASVVFGFWFSQRVPDAKKNGAPDPAPAPPTEVKP